MRAGAEDGTLGRGAEGEKALCERLLTRDQVSEVFARFERRNPNPRTELTAPNDYCFLVSVVLSAQATDRSVNLATGRLYREVTTPEQMIALGEERLKGYIKSIGLYNSKARNIIRLSELLVERYGGRIPRDREALESLPGVGRKTANVVLNAVFGEPTMPVDTHLLRICPRIGLTHKGSALLVEKELLERIDARYLKNAHYHLVLHGRYVCTARRPRCAECVISDICLRNGVPPASRAKPPAPSAGSTM